MSPSSPGSTRAVSTEASAGVFLKDKSVCHSALALATSTWRWSGGRISPFSPTLVRRGVEAAGAERGHLGELERPEGAAVGDLDVVGDRLVAEHQQRMLLEGRAHGLVGLGVARDVEHADALAPRRQIPAPAAPAPSRSSSRSLCAGDFIASAAPGRYSTNLASKALQTSRWHPPPRPLPALLSLPPPRTPPAPAKAALEKRYGAVYAAEADVIVALGGDGLMLQTLHRNMRRGTPIFGMNLGTVGFLMNNYRASGLPAARSASARQVTLTPLRMLATNARGQRLRGDGDQRGLAAALEPADRAHRRLDRRHEAHSRPLLRRRASWPRRRARPPTTSPPMARSCRSARACWR